MKAHVKSYVNEGNSVTPPSDLKTAIESRGSISGVRVAVLGVNNTNSRTYKLEGINTFNIFRLTTKDCTPSEPMESAQGNFSIGKKLKQVSTIVANCISENIHFEWYLVIKGAICRL